MTGYVTPYSASRRWLRGNPHLHTKCGKSDMPISISGPIYANLGYDFLCVTDHNKALSEEELADWQEKAGLVLIPGEENGKGDLIELGVHEVAKTTDPSFSARVRDLKRAGGFVLACHPQQYEDGPANVLANAHNLDAVEIYNSNRFAVGLDELANVTLWDSALTNGERLLGIAADDFHAKSTTPGHGWICLQVPGERTEVTWQFLVSQLRKGAFYSTTSIFSQFDQILLENGMLVVECSHLVRSIRVIGPEGCILSRQNGPRLEWQLQDGLSYFRIEAICGGINRAWSQPFYSVDHA